MTEQTSQASETRPATLLALARHPAIAWVFLALALLATAIVWHSTRQALIQRAQDRFLLQSEEIRDYMVHRLGEYQALLRGGAGLFNASQSVERDEWRHYVESLDIRRNYPGIQGMGFSKRIPPEALTAHEAAIRAEGFPDYRVRPAGERPVYTAIIYLEPFDWRNQRAFGYDMYSEPVRREAMDRARDTGQTALSGIVTLVQETDQDVQKGLLMYRPVYRKGAKAETLVERRAALEGFVYYPLRAKNLLQAIVGHITHIHLHVFDGPPSEETLLMESGPGADRPSTDPAFRHTLELTIGGRTWTLQTEALPGFITIQEAQEPLLFALGGTLASLLLFLYVRSLAGQHRRVLAKAQEMTVELRDSEERFRTLVEFAPDAIIVIDEQGIIRQCNPAAERFFGYRVEELIGRNIGLLMPSPDREAHGEYIARYLASGEAHVIGIGRDVQALRKDGSRVTIHLRVGEQHLANDERRFIGFIRDLSERLKAEEELLGHRQRLEEMVAARTAELEQARIAADAANRSKSEFLANMSHEIRTPLNAVLGLAQVGQRDNTGRRSQETFCRILHAGQLLLSLVNDILDFSKIEAGKMTLEQAPFDLGEAIDRAVDVNSARAFDKGIDFQVEEAADLPRRFVGDSLRLTQVLVNLLSNAIKFTERGQVRLDVRWDAGTLRFHIEDSGIGMSMEQRERLFSPFEQADGSTTRRYGGTGLGLAITHRLVELMGGTIAVESQPDAGSRFEICLPLPVAEAATALEKSPSPLSRGEGWGEGEASPSRERGIIHNPSVGKRRVVLLGLQEGENLALRQALAERGIEAIGWEPALGPSLEEKDLLLLTEERLGESHPAAPRIAVVHTPGRTPEHAVGLPFGMTRLDRPLRARHLIALLEGDTGTTAPIEQRPRLAGYRVLAAEDNEVNRFVLERMILDEGARLLCVENGREAVDQVRRDGPEAWDILLMDIQMPEMDGHEAARRIREFAPDLPIVGLTAHAMVEERERCLASGMRDHLTKPIELDDLISAIHRIARPPQADIPVEPLPALAPPVSPQPTEPPGEGSVIDWSKLKRRYASRPGFVPRLAALARQSQAETPAKLRALAAAGEMAPLGELAHALKGVAGNLAADGIQELAARLHGLTKGNDPEAAPLAEVLATQVEEMLKALAQVKV